MKKYNPHECHRIRLRERFRKETLVSFNDHLILELLLTFGIPRKDLNVIGHNLINTFGSLSAVFDADYNALLKVDGIGEVSATLIKLIPQLSRAYLLDKCTRYTDYSDLRKLGDYLVRYFIGETREKVVIVLLNNKMEMIDISVVNEGIVNRSDCSVRKITEAAIMKNAAAFVLAHNHPDGDSTPSSSDVNLTSIYVKIFEGLGIPLAEHFVIGRNSYTTIISRQRTGDFCNESDLLI